MGYYLPFKKSEIVLLFAATWMKLEMIILSKSKRERQIPYDITYMWNLKYDTNNANELIYKTETDSQAWKTNLWLPKGKRGRRWINCLEKQRVKRSNRLLREFSKIARCINLQYKSIAFLFTSSLTNF